MKSYLLNEHDTNNVNRINVMLKKVQALKEYNPALLEKTLRTKWGLPARRKAGK